MDKVAFTPSLCQGEDAPFAGDIVYTAPTIDEYFEYLEDLKDVLQFDADGTVKNEGDVMGNIGTIRRVLKYAQGHYDKIKIKKADGTEYKSYDQLSRDRDAYPILIEAGMQIVFGQQPEKN